MCWINVWHVGGRHVESSSRFRDIHVDYTVITEDNHIVGQHGKLIPFDPDRINSYHWLYTLANHYGMLPKE